MIYKHSLCTPRDKAKKMGILLSLAHVSIFATFVVGFFFHHARPEGKVGLGLSGQKLLNLHQLLMTVAFVVNMSENLFFMKSSFYTVVKRRLAHVVVMAFGTVIAVLGVVAGFMYKHLEGKPHFHTIHGWIGVAVLAAAVGHISLAMAVYWGGFMNSIQTKKAMCMARTAFGRAIYFGGIVGMLTGLVEMQRDSRSHVLPYSIMETYSNVFGCLILITGALVTAVLDVLPSRSREIFDHGDTEHPLLLK